MSCDLIKFSGLTLWSLKSGYLKSQQSNLHEITTRGVCETRIINGQRVDSKQMQRERGRRSYLNQREDPLQRQRKPLHTEGPTLPENGFKLACKTPELKIQKTEGRCSQKNKTEESTNSTGRVAPPLSGLVGKYLVRYRKEI